jgi:Cd2+/Zn2+-exporting ATPase
MEAAPSETTVIRNGEEITVPSREVGPNEITVIRPGERIALDGIVTEGYSTVIQAAITGESTPMHAVPGSQVYAGSLNERGSLRIRVTNVFEDTILSRIIHLVEEAQQKRAPVQTFVERFARVYTPAVFTLAFLIAVVPPLLLQLSFEEWFYRGLVLLVIACPCALVISTPVTIVSAITHAARRGVLIKGGLHLEMVSKLRSLAFDKTGTLTKGKPNVTDVVPLNSFSREKTLQFAAALEYHSEHHLATAILTEAEKLSIPYETIRVENFESIPGMGIQATIDGRRYYLGNHRFCEERGYCSPTVEQQLEVFAREGKTGVVLGIEHEPIALIALSDTARTEGRATIASLRQSGIEHLVLLSGDNEAAARSLATDVGLTEWAAAQLPEQKLEAVENLKRRYGVVGMVGDGVNDAPALAAASVGIAMGVSGTDAALESADVVLMSDDIAKIPLVVSLSRRAMAIVKQNIALALLTKGLFLALSISGNATLWMAVLADDGAALAVILNGLRLLAFRGD